MATRTIEVIVEPTGELRIDAIGFTGADCEKATKFLEAALGRAKLRSKKPEYYRTVRQEQRLQR